jgi:FixJ family two-component response regulator
MSGSRAVVHVIDDDPSFLRSLCRLLKAAGYDARPHPSADRFLADSHDATDGCVLTDLQMPGVGGLELQRTVVASDNPLPVVFITGRGDVSSAVRAMRAGAEDFLDKHATPQQILSAISRAVARGARERAARARRHEALRLLAGLTPQERAVMGLAIKGMINKQIGRIMGLAERTAKYHRTRISRKIGLTTLPEWIQLANDAHLTADDLVEDFLPGFDDPDDT